LPASRARDTLRLRLSLLVPRRRRTQMEKSFCLWSCCFFFFFCVFFFLFFSLGFAPVVPYACNIFARVNPPPPLESLPSVTLLGGLPGLRRFLNILSSRPFPSVKPPPPGRVCHPSEECLKNPPFQPYFSLDTLAPPFS